MFSPGPVIPTGQLTLDWNTEDRLDVVSTGDTLAVGGPKCSRILLGQRPVAPTFETQALGSFINNKIVGSFSSVYNGSMDPNIKALQFLNGDITGTNTAFTTDMLDGGVILWEDGGVSPIAAYTSPTAIATLTTISTSHASQRFKIYYNGSYMDGVNGVVSTVSQVTSSIDTKSINAQSVVIAPVNVPYTATPPLIVRAAEAKMGVATVSITNSDSTPSASITSQENTDDDRSLLLVDSIGPMGNILELGRRSGSAPVASVITIGEANGTNLVDISANAAIQIQTIDNAGALLITANAGNLLMSGGSVTITGNSFISADCLNFLLPDIPALLTPNNLNAAGAGVDIGGLYSDQDDPARVYIRKV